MQPVGSTVVQMRSTDSQEDRTVEKREYMWLSIPYPRRKCQTSTYAETRELVTHANEFRNENAIYWSC
jgi:hypothetical protein